MSLLNQMELLDNQIKVNTEISHKEDITTMSMIIENEFEMKIEENGIYFKYE